MPEKLPLFLDFENSRLPVENYHFLRESGYERGIRFDREWGRGNYIIWDFIEENNVKDLY